MIKSLSFTNFKSWQDTGDIQFAPITALFGSNSSGKSSLLQMLLMLKQTTESSDRKQVLHFGDAQSPVELGTFKDTVNAHDLDSDLTWAIDWTLRDPITVESPAATKTLFEFQEIGFSARIGWHAGDTDVAGRAYVRDMHYRIEDASFGMRHQANLTEYELYCDPQRSYRFKRSRGRPRPLPPPAKCYGFPDEVRAFFSNVSFLSDFELQLERFAASVYYLGPLREHPRRQYTWGGANPADMGRRGEKVVDALLASRQAGKVFARRKGIPRQTLEERVAHWLKELGLIESFRVQKIAKDAQLYQVMVKKSVTSAEVLITDVGFGVSQILPVITLCYYVPEGSVVLLEQPEIHLHPKVQAGLADVLIDAAKSQKIQIVLESHSEHLLRRLQRRIAEEKLNVDDAAVYFCSMDAGRSHLSRIDVDTFGRVSNWPKDFFGDQFEEIAATSDAAFRRQGRA